MQELVAIAPIRISPALDRTLGLGRYVYLGLAVLGASPPVPVLSSAVTIRSSAFTGRHSYGMISGARGHPGAGRIRRASYCRFLCPCVLLLG